MPRVAWGRFFMMHWSCDPPTPGPRQYCKEREIHLPFSTFFSENLSSLHQDRNPAWIILLAAARIVSCTRFVHLFKVLPFHCFHELVAWAKSHYPVQKWSGGLQTCVLVTMRHGENHFLSLRLSFLIHKMRGVDQMLSKGSTSLNYKYL